jgi:hypothetical protein
MALVLARHYEIEAQHNNAGSPFSLINLKTVKLQEETVLNTIVSFFSANFVRNNFCFNKYSHSYT